MFVSWISSAFDAKTLGFVFGSYFFLTAIFADNIVDGANILPITHQGFCNKNLVHAFTEDIQVTKKSKLIFALTFRFCKDEVQQELLPCDIK